MHEQSETIQGPDGRWINVYGRNTPRAGQQLPGSGDFGSVEEAVAAARARSESHGTRQRLEAALLNAHRAGDTAAARVLAGEIERQRSAEGFSQIRPRNMEPQRTSIDPESPSVLARLGRGFKDIPESVRYIASGGKRDPAADEEERLYQAGRGPNAGFDAMRFAANTAGTFPATGALGVGATAAKLIGPISKAVVGATSGGIQGALTHTPEGESKTSQALIGFGSGAVAPFVADAVSSVVSRVAQFGKEAAARFAAKPEAIVAELEPILAKQGVNWATLGDDVKQGILLQARRQLTVSGELAPDALARKVEMDDLLGPGAGPTQGQVTRNPQQWSWERNTQKLQDVGEPLTTKFQAQIQRLRDVAAEAIAKTGGRARNDFQAGTEATRAVKQKMDDSGRVVDDLYAAWRDTGAGGTTVKPQAIADALGKVMDDIGEENIPAAVRSRLASFGMLGEKQKKLLTIDEAEKLRRLIGNNDPGHGPASLASQRLRRAVDDAVMETDAPDIPALKQARATAAARFAMRDSASGVEAAARNDAPDRFFTRFVLNGDVGDLRGLKQTLNTTVTGQSVPKGFDAEPVGAQAWKDLKGRVIEHVVEKATVKDGSFSGPQFRKALKEIGEERMKILFDADELAQLQKLDRVAFDLTAEPNLAAVNHSNTAAAGAQYLGDAGRIAGTLAEKATGIPFVGKMAAGAWSAGDQLAKTAEMRKRVSQSLLGNAFDPGEVISKRTELAKLISGYLTPVGTTAGVGLAERFTPRD